jgi:hypothetical protein
LPEDAGSPRDHWLAVEHREAVRDFICAAERSVRPDETVSK